MPVNNKSWTRERTLALTQLAALTAIVVILQLVGATIKFGGFSINLTLVPITVAAALFGTRSVKWGILAGAWLGAVSGAIVLISGDAAPFLEFSVWATVLVVMIKGILSGVAAGSAYALLNKKSRLAAVSAAAVLAPVVNTGIFVIGCFAFFLPKIKEWTGDKTAAEYIFLIMAGWNFIIELAINIALVGAMAVIVRSVELSNKQNGAEQA